MAAWAPTLAAEPGPALLRLYTTAEPAYFTPDQARRFATELTNIADAAETT